MPHVSGGGSFGGGGFNANNIGNVIHGTNYHYGNSGIKLEDPNDGSDHIADSLFNDCFPS